jgi:hypothetical protein
VSGAAKPARRDAVTLRMVCITCTRYVIVCDTHSALRMVLGPVGVCSVRPARAYRAASNAPLPAVDSSTSDITWEVHAKALYQTNELQQLHVIRHAIVCIKWVTAYKMVWTIFLNNVRPRCGNSTSQNLIQ